MTGAAVSTSSNPPVRAPRVRGHWLFGTHFQMRNDPLGTMTRAMEQFGDAIFLQLGPYRATVFRNPEHIKRILVDNASNYSKQTRGYIKARIALGQGLVTSEGELWQRQRRIATPAFNRQRVARFGETMVNATQAMLEEWSKRASSGEVTLDVFAEMMRVTLHIAVETLLGVGPSAELDRVSVAVSEVLERTNDIITNPVSLPTWVPIPKNLRFVRAIGILDRFVYETIARRRAGGAAGGDLLSMLLSARDEQTGESMSDRQLRDEAVTILIAGHETTANALSWSLYLLGTHPSIQQRLHDELDRALAGRIPSAEDLPNLPFTRAVIDESMRLYPPAWMIGRSAIRDDVIGPYSVKAGEFALVSPYMTHRNPHLWDAPDRFDPDRFLDGRADRAPKFSYIPFGGGQRFCIGANFANLQSVLMLSSILQKFSMQVDETHPVMPYAMITLRPKHGIRMHVQKRP